MGIREFIQLSLTVIEDRLTEKKPHFGKRKYDEPALLLTDDTTSFYLQVLAGQSRLLVLPVDSSITDAEKQQLAFQAETLPFTTLDDLVTFYREQVVITRNADLDTWRSLYCSCIQFAKKKKCRHVYHYLRSVGRLDLLEITVISEKRKRGRPKNVRKNTSLQTDGV